uniref:Uncharacterized protein n=1 Tax=Steinernema glaseri TaxID=37863 RepID=A0A1I7Y8H4_9BILA
MRPVPHDRGPKLLVGDPLSKQPSKCKSARDECTNFPNHLTLIDRRPVSRNRSLSRSPTIQTKALVAGGPPQRRASVPVAAAGGVGQPAAHRLIFVFRSNYRF